MVNALILSEERMLKFAVGAQKPKYPVACAYGNFFSFTLRPNTSSLALETRISVNTAPIHLFTLITFQPY
jgi:hypothetical protein